MANFEIDPNNNTSTEEKLALTVTLRRILAGKFSGSSFRQTLFRLLSSGRGKTIIEILLQIAAEVPQLQIVQLLVNAAGNFCDHDKKTVLHYVSRYGWLAIAQTLLSEGADPNAKDTEGKTPIIEAANARHRDIVELLVDSGADVLCCSRNNYTLLHAAAGTGWIDFVRFLLKKGANPNAAVYGSCTPLYPAILQSERDTVALLIDHGADTVFPTFRGFPVLHYAVMVSSLEVVKCLVEKGADVNDKRVEGLSPLDIALRGSIDEGSLQKIQMIEYLVKAVNLKNGSNVIPLKYIMRHCPKLKLIKAFVERYGYLNKFIDDYYGTHGNLSLKSDIFQNVHVCSQAIINKFNNKYLPAFYNLDLPDGTLPPLHNLMIKSPGIIQDIEQSVRNEINTSEHCDLRKPKVIVLSMLAVESYTNYYNYQLREKALRQKRSATADSGEAASSKVQRLN